MDEVPDVRLKAARYARLVAGRKACRMCPGLINPAEVESGRLDAGHVGPWSRWQGNLGADLMVVGQDWGDVRYFVANRGWDATANPTNRTLAALLRSIGVDVGALGEGAGEQQVFLTNAILCLKQGGLQAKVKRDWFENCAGHLREQIEIVRPRVVVGLGELAFGSLLRAFGLKARAFRVEVGDAAGTSLPTGSRAFAVYHCGRRILNTHRRMEAQLWDWKRIGRALRDGLA